MLRHILRFTLFVSLALAQCSVVFAQTPSPNANSDGRYQALRHPQLGQAFQVTGLVLKRDVGTFTLSGTLCLLQPVEGMVTGAVFRGFGTFTLTTDDRLEQRQIAYLTKGQEMKEEFDHLVLRFADGTDEEIRKSAAASAGSGGCAADALDEAGKVLHDHRHFYRNFDGRLLQPVLNGKPDGFFLAFIPGRKFSDRLIFTIDPWDDEEVSFYSVQESKYGSWYSQHLLSERAAHGPRDHPFGMIKATHHKIEASFEKSGEMQGTASTTFRSNVDGLRVVPFELFRTLRVTRVTDAGGSTLNWIQEEKNDDPEYLVILPKPLARGEETTLITSYEGKDAVQNTGNGNYYPVARENWYPNTYFGDYATYELTLRVPKGLTMAATGTLVSNQTEGSQNTTVWRSEAPLAVAGFNFGDFKEKDVKLDKIGGFEVKAFANRELPDQWKSKEFVPANGDVLGGQKGSFFDSLSTTPLLDKSLAEAQLSILLFTDYFGPLPYKSLYVTQQTANNFGQSWPGLVYLPITYFMDTTQRHFLGWDENHSYFRVVEPHEVSHQWWAHTVGFDNYRDQWMSEGFADFSASLFVQLIRNNRKEYEQFWIDQRRVMLERNKEGFRAIDAGPLTLGRRLSNARTGGDIYHDLIYPKGSWVLQMLRMLMFSAEHNDNRFKAMMQDFVKTYANRSATTEDFKRMVEKHMVRQMDMDGNHTMDWFFDDWVYGTQIPDYSVTSQFTRDGDNVFMDIAITQRNVDASFRNMVPLYLELADGRIGHIGVVALKGTQTITEKVPLGKLSSLPKRALINANFDTLCTIDGK